MIKKILIIVPIVLIMSLSLYLSGRAFLMYRQDYIDVYVASHQISQRTKLSDQDITTIRLPKQVISDDIYNDENDILGKYVKLSYSIAKGSLFYKGYLEEDIKDLAGTLLKDGQVCYDLYVNEIKVNTATLSDNMLIDIYLSINTNNKPISDLLIEDCRILSIFDSNNKQIFSYNSDLKPYIISIAINKEEVILLNKAMMLGEISVIVSSNTYREDILSKVNKTCQLLEYLQ